MPLLTRIRQLASELEASEGTAEALLAADVQVDYEELESTFEIEQQPRVPLKATLSKTPSVGGIRHGAITGKTEAKPGVDATTAPQARDIMLACGLQEMTLKTVALVGAPTGTFEAGEPITGDAAGVGYFIRLDSLVLMYAETTAFAASEAITGGVSGATATTHGTPALTEIGFAYRPDSTGNDSYTFGDYMNGMRKLIFGARGNLRLEAAGTGELGYLNFNLQGKELTPTDTALLTGVTITDVVPETFLSAQVACDGDSIDIDTLGLDLQNTVARRPSANEGTGIVSYRITDRDPVINIDPETLLEATKDFFGEFAADTLFHFYAQIGSSVGKRVMLVASKCKWQELSPQEREGIAVHGAQLQPTIVDGDDEVIIAFG